MDSLDSTSIYVLHHSFAATITEQIVSNHQLKLIDSKCRLFLRPDEHIVATSLRKPLGPLTIAPVLDPFIPSSIFLRSGLPPKWTVVAWRRDSCGMLSSSLLPSWNHKLGILCRVDISVIWTCFASLPLCFLFQRTTALEAAAMQVHKKSKCKRALEVTE